LLLLKWMQWMRRRGSWKMVERAQAPHRPPEPYLERFYLLRIGRRADPFFALFLHRFWSSDPDEPHDHPWPWGSLILTRGYDECGVDGIWHWRRPWAVRFRQAEVLHRVSLRESDRGRVWTLFWHGRRSRKWGFVTRGGWTSAEATGDQDQRQMRGWLLPRFVGEETADGG